MNRKAVFMVCVSIVLALILTACGGGSSGGSAGKPEDAVKGFFEAVFAGKGDAATFVCSSAKAQVDQMKASFDQMKTTLTAAGGTVDISGFTYTKKSESGDTASVEVAGKIKVTVSGAATEQDFPTLPVPLKKEGDAWKVCA